MSSLYVPRQCAFHPKEFIFNFCRNSDCLLPLCPSCVKVHSQQHKLQGSHGQFENMEKLVENIDGFLGELTKQLQGCCQEINEANVIRGKTQQGIKRKMNEAKTKMMGLVERFFIDFEKEVTKSIISYNESMNENYSKIKLQIKQLNDQIHTKRSNLTADKVLKTVINYYSKNDQQIFKDTIQGLKNQIMQLEERKVDVICQQSSAQKIIDQLGNYIHLEFENWENQIKYVGEFIKTGFTAQKSQRKLSHLSSQQQI